MLNEANYASYCLQIQDKDSYSKELEQTVEALQSRADAAESANEGLLSRIEKV